MKKKHILGMFCLSIGAFGLTTISALASEERPQAESESTVLFEPDKKSGDEEVFPPDGGEGGTIDPGGSDGGKGDGNKSFNIVWVSNFRFNDRKADGTFEPIKLNGNGMKLWAKGTKLTLNLLNEDKKPTGEKKTYEDIPNFVLITDNRGTSSGWNLSVSRTAFSGRDAKNQLQELKGSALTLNNQSLSGPEGVAAPILNEGLEIDQTAKRVLSAAPNAGTGSWWLNFGEENEDGKLVDKTGVKLDIPGSAQPKANVEYQSTLTWTLENGPKE